MKILLLSNCKVIALSWSKNKKKRKEKKRERERDRRPLKKEKEKKKGAKAMMITDINSRKTSHGELLQTSTKGQHTRIIIILAY